MRHSTILAVIAGVLTCASRTPATSTSTWTSAATRCTPTSRFRAPCVTTGAQRPPEVAARTYAAQQATNNQQLAASNQRIAQGENDPRVAANVAKDLEATRAERCKKAREDYNRPSTRAACITDDKDGKRIYLSDAELAASASMRQAVESICGPQG